MAHLLVGGLSKQCPGRIGLQYPTAMQQADAIGKGKRFGLVVGHVDHGRTDFLLHGLQLPPELPLERWLHRRERLVEQNQRQLGTDQRSTDGHELLLEQGQAGRPAAHQLCDAQAPGHGIRSAAPLGGAHATGLKRKLQILRHA